MSNTYIFVFKICRVVICIYSPDHTTRLMHLKRCLAKAFLLMAPVVRLECQYICCPLVFIVSAVLFVYSYG